MLKLRRPSLGKRVVAYGLPDFLTILDRNTRLVASSRLSSLTLSASGTRTDGPICTSKYIILWNGRGDSVYAVEGGAALS